MKFTDRRSVSLVIIPVLVAAIFVVPALVRATYPSQSAPIRLNRGFDAPPSKCTLEAPHAILIPFEYVREVTRDRRDHVVLDLGILSPDAPDSRSPDPFRGPPSPA